jgi:hypothetical protein
VRPRRGHVAATPGIFRRNPTERSGTPWKRGVGLQADRRSQAASVLSIQAAEVLRDPGSSRRESAAGAMKRWSFLLGKADRAAATP